MGRAAVGPPGWPPRVPPPDAPGWQDAAVAWLFDQCPPDYRAHAVWRRHPVALAWVAHRHLEAQLAAMREAYRHARVELRDLVPEGAMAPVLTALEVEGIRLVAAHRSAGLLLDALEGNRYVPRL